MKDIIAKYIVGLDSIADWGAEKGVPWLITGLGSIILFVFNLIIIFTPTKSIEWDLIAINYILLCIHYQIVAKDTNLKKKIDNWYQNNIQEKVKELRKKDNS